MADNNFLQFDPAKNNIASDATYDASSYRTSGARTGLAPSNIHNKLFYQVSTFVAAFAEMMATAKGYDMSDSDITTLTSQLGNVMTKGDMSVYALVSQLSGYVAKNAVVSKTDDYIVTTTDCFKTLQANKATSISFTLPTFATLDTAHGTGKAWIKFKNIGAGTLTLVGTVDGTTNPTLSTNEEITVYSDGTALRGKTISGVALSQFSSSLTANGYQELPSGLILQWGTYANTVYSDNPYSVTFAKAFPTAVLNVSATIRNNEGHTGRDNYMQVCNETTTGAVFMCQASIASGIPAVGGFFWQAIGY
jgi:hypothetical protein